MAQQTMYEGKVNSPVTTITTSLLDVVSGTIETVDVADETYFPSPPGLATIGNGPSAETVLYTDITGSTVTIERGFEGETSAWSIGTPIGRFFTAYDHEAFRNNIEDLNNRSLKNADIGVNVQAYDTNIVSDALYVQTENNYTTIDMNKLTGIAENATVDQNSSEVPYDNVASGLTATNVKSALDEVQTNVENAIMTDADILAGLINVDGTGSNLDADLLDGQQGSYYLAFANMTSKPDPTITLAGDATGNVTLTDLGSGTLTVAVVDDSHNHIISNVDGLQTALDGKYDKSGGTITGDATVTGFIKTGSWTIKENVDGSLGFFIN